MKKWKEKLNEEQEKAVTHWGSPLLVLAGAGSGKTRVLTYRTAWLVEEKGIGAEKIVLLTFTNKAAGEMRERVGKLVEREGEMKLGFTGTFHTFCSKLLRRYGGVLGIEPGFVIYDTKDKEMVIKELGERMGVATGNGQKRKIAAFISKMKNELYSVNSVGSWMKTDYQKKLVDLWREYDKSLQASQALDFDDLLVKGVELLKKDEIRGKVHEEYGWVLVDEYQDTNKAQFELSKLLVPEGKRLTVVGDVAQAIYSFRGADFRNLDLLKGEFKDLSVVELGQNYRSTQKILDVAYEMLKNNKNHPVLRLEAAGGEGKKVEVVELADERQEAREVINRCEEGEKKGRSVAVLYRTNAQSRSFEEELMKRGLAYQLVGGIRFYQRAEIKDLTAYLRYLYNEKDSVSKKRLEKVGKRRLKRLEEWIEKEEREKLLKRKPVELIERILEVTDYLNKFKEEDEKDRARMENIEELMAVASESGKVGEFLEKIALIEADEEAERGKNKETKIHLMTVHAAKGLEFDEVWVVGMEEGLFPHSRSLNEEGEIEEERRLLYVAITRAREKAGMSYVRNRLIYGGRSSQSPSRFLREIPEKLLEKIVKGARRRRGERRGWSKGLKGEWEGEIKSVRKWEDEWGEGKRKIVQDWEIESETKNDFEEIDNW